MGIHIYKSSISRCDFTKMFFVNNLYFVRHYCFKFVDCILSLYICDKSKLNLVPRASFKNISKERKEALGTSLNYRIFLQLGENISMFQFFQ